MPHRRAISIGLLLAFAFACAGGGANPRRAAEAPPPAASSAPPTPAAAAAPGLTDFAFALQPRLAAADSNLAWSPAGLGEALAMVYAGAGGVTRAEMSAVLGLAPAPGVAGEAWGRALRDLATRGDSAVGVAGQPFRLAVASALWPDAGITPGSPFLADMQRNFGADVTTLDYKHQPEAALRRVNAWSKAATSGHIPELVTRKLILECDGMLVTTAVYFNSRWQEPFQMVDPGADFTRLDGTKVEAPRLRGYSTAWRVGQGADWQAAELPYDDERLDFLIVVPRGDFLAFQAGWTAAACQAIRDSLRVQAAFVMMPPFDLARNQPSRPALEASGLEHLFNATADLRGLAPNDPLQVYEVRQRLRLNVSKEGTVGAAATVVALRTIGGHQGDATQDPLVIKADRPFLFALRDRPTGLLLFMGRVVDPTTAGPGGGAVQLGAWQKPSWATVRE